MANFAIPAPTALKIPNLVPPKTSATPTTPLVLAPTANRSVYNPATAYTPATAPLTVPAAATPTIPLSALQAAPAQPAQVNAVIPTPTAASGAQAYIQSAVVDPYSVAGTAQTAQQSQSGASSALETLLREQLGAPTQSALTADAYARGGVNSAEAELGNINSQITAEQVSARHRIEKIQANNPLGKSSDAISQEVEQVNRESLSKQADLAVTQLAAQGKVDLATKIADRAVDGIMEAETQKLSVLNTVYQYNKDLFDKDDQRAFETAQQERQTKAANEEYRLRSQFDEQIKQSDPLYQANLRGQNLQNSKLANDLSPQATTNKNATTASSVGNALTAINTANNQLGKLTTGFIGGLARHIGGTSAANLNATIDTIKSSLTFDTLSQLKANSPTGASGLGALSDNEAKLLASQVASLDTAQSASQLKTNLATVQQHYVDYLSTLGYGYDKETNTIIAP